MDNYFETILLEAILKCNDYTINYHYNRFNNLYPFTTENINGYIKYFNLENKSLLTTGSSSDQLINACLFNCQDITIIDICPFTKFYFYLKMSAFMNLNYNEFINFFCYKDFPKTFTEKKNTFNLNSYNKIKGTLRLLDYESYLFWDELFVTYPPEKIRRKLFSHDEYKLSILKNTNLYLNNDEYYNKVKNVITKIAPKFIINNILEFTPNRNFDNIWLSNIGQYISLEDTKIIIDKLVPYLNDKGKMLICYLYDTTKNSEYDNNFAEIYDLKRTAKILKDYNYELINFSGINNFLFGCNNFEDAILVYKKTLKNSKQTIY